MSRPTLPRLAAAGLFVLLVATADRLPAQPAAKTGKKVLTHADYDIWKAAPQGMTLSRDGKYIAYTQYPIDGPGDAEVIVRHLPSGKETRIARGGRPATPEGAGGPPGGFTPPPSFAGGSPQFTPDSAKLVFPLSPTKAEVDAAKAAKTKTEDMPRPVLAVMELATGKITAKIAYEKGFAVGGSGAGFLIYHVPPKIEPKVDSPPGKVEGEPKAEPKAEPEPREPRTGQPGGKKGGFGGKGGFGQPGGTAPAPRAVRSYGTELVVCDLASGSERSLADVLEYSLTKDNKAIVYAVASKKEETNGVFVIDPSSMGAAITIKAGPGRYTRLVWDEKQTKLAFLFDATVPPPMEAPAPRPVGTPGGTAAPVPPPQPKWHVYVWDRNTKPVAGPMGNLPITPGGPGGALPGVAAAGVAANFPLQSPATEVLTPDAPGMKKGWALTGGGLSFSSDSSKVYVSTAPVKERDANPTPAAPTGPGEKVDLDIWHWKDGLIQPMQKVRGNPDGGRSFSAVVFLDSKQFRQLSDETVTVSPPAVGDWGVATDDKKYLHLTGYASPVPRDVAVVNIRTGEKKPVLTAFGGASMMSPNAKFLLTFDGKDWSSISIPDGKKTNLTANLAVKFFNEDHDSPSDPSPYGVTGWTTDGKFVLVSDRYDIWKLAADGSSAENVTKTGRELQVRFRRVNVDEDGDADDDRKGVDLAKPMLLHAENLYTRDTGFFRMDPGGKPKMLVMGARRYFPPTKAKNADTYLLQISTFSDYPDYYATGPDFTEMKKVTDVNPRTKEFNWGKAELVHYKSVDGVPLAGVLIKPENFDPSKKYPMIVYIYERLSDTVHGFRMPTAGTSINPTFYASNGYLVFMPDIAYKVGYPGQSALKCVLPAIQAVVDKGFVDEKAIGIQGHSWGGYQIAYMITQTDRFKAAAAGAPVSNMVSAYGGIRWGTGLPRQFQYEKTQSRIGGTLWDHPMRFIENSPIFMADRVNTPLLMLHNDQDDAVPWYQGIEYFLALRRLGKECYMLNYNGERHGLTRKATQRDYTVRMFHFFEHHLKGKPAPEWMEKGVPYADREKEKEAWRKLFNPEGK